MPNLTDFLSTKINFDDQDPARKLDNTTKTLNDVGDVFLSFARGAMGGRTISCVNVNSTNAEGKSRSYPTFSNEQRVEGVYRALSIIATIIFLPFAILGTILGAICKGSALKDPRLETRYKALTERDKLKIPALLAANELDAAMQLQSSEKIKAVLEKIKHDPHFKGWDQMYSEPDNSEYNGVDIVANLQYLKSEDMANRLSNCVHRPDAAGILSIYLKHYSQNETSKDDFFQNIDDINNLIEDLVNHSGNRPLYSYNLRSAMNRKEHVARIEQEFHNVWPKSPLRHELVEAHDSIDNL